MSLGGERTDLSKAVWLFLLEEGGWWTCDAISAALGRSDLSGYLIHLAKRGLLLRKDGKPHQYSVNLDCKIVRRVTLRDLVKHGLQQLLAEAETEGSAP